MATIRLKPEHMDMTNRVARRHGFVNYVIEFSPGPSKGENYLSTIIYATLIEKSIDQRLDLVLKIASDNETFRKNMDVISNCFLREVYMYETLLPALTIYQKDKHEKFTSFPKEYISDLTFQKEIVVLENMKAKNYVLWDRTKPMDESHVLLVLKNYAKFHGTCLAMGALDPEMFQSLTANLKNIWMPETEEQYSETEKCTAVAFDLAEKAVAGLESETASLRNFREGIKDFVINKMSVSSDDDVVVTHGDCWCNNMMFKYENSEDTTNPTDICLIDWQLSRKGSPLRDIAYFLYCSVSGRDLSNNIDKYLECYYDELSKYLHEFGCDPAKIFPFALLEDHWKKYSKLGLYISIMMMRIILNEGSKRTTEEYLQLKTESDTLFKNYDAYNSRIKDLVIFSVERNYI